MKVKRVVMENYGAFYGRHEFQVSDRGLVLILGENQDEPRMNSNGSAKSTLLESMDWCLFGVVPKGDHADSVVNDEAKGCAVTTYLEDDDGTQAEIRRERPAALAFMVGGEDRAGLDAKETQGAIDAWLGMDREVFHAAVFFGQQDLRHFADATDGQRMEILSRIIPELGQVDQLLGAAKARKTKVERELDEARQRVAEKDGEIRALESMDYQAQIEDWEQRRQAELASYQANLDDLEAQQKALGDWAATVATLEQQAANLTAVQIPPAPTTVPGLEEAHVAVMAANGAVAAARSEVQRLGTEQSGISEVGEGRCSRCGSMVTGNHLRAEMDRLEADKQAAMRELAGAEAAQAVAQEGADRLNVNLQQAVRYAQAAAQRHAQEVGTVRADLERARANARQAEGFAQRIANGRQMIEAKKAEVNPMIAQAQQMQDRLKALKGAWRGNQNVVAGKERELARVQFWVDGFGARGLKSYILDSKLQEMTDAANEWVRLLTGGTFWVRFESQKMGRSTKTLRNAPSIRVFKYQPDGRITERSFRGWSGGERQRVSWCIDFGLSRLVARRATKRWDFLALDEVFKYVDQAGGEAVAEMLTYLQREKSSIFVIEHDGEFQSHFETVVLVRKQGARSRVVEDADAQGERQATIQPGRVSEGSKPRKRKPARVQAKPDKKARPKRTPARLRVPADPPVR